MVILAPPILEHPVSFEFKVPDSQHSNGPACCMGTWTTLPATNRLCPFLPDEKNVQKECMLKAGIMVSPELLRLPPLTLFAPEDK